MHTLGYETFVLSKDDKKLINERMDLVEEDILRDPNNDYCIIQSLRRFTDAVADKKTALEIAHNHCTKEDCSMLVPFYRQRSAKLKALEERYEKENVSLAEYRKKQNVKNRKSKSATCEKRDSRLTIKWLKNNDCPVCGSSLLSKTVRETIERKEEAITKLSSEIRTEMKKSEGQKTVRSNQTINYLLAVAYDYHS